MESYFTFRGPVFFGQPSSALKGAGSFGPNAVIRMYFVNDLSIEKSFLGGTIVRRYDIYGWALL